jgi:hypothetical protein
MGPLSGLVGLGVHRPRSFSDIFIDHGKTEDDMFRSLAGGGDVPGEEAIKGVLRRPLGT